MDSTPANVALHHHTTASDIIILIGLDLSNFVEEALGLDFVDESHFVFLVRVVDGHTSVIHSCSVTGLASQRAEQGRFAITAVGPIRGG